MSKTDENLKAAVAGESLARNRYSYFAEMAKKEGYRYIAKIFEEIAENEKYHAMEELRLLMGDRILSQLMEEPGQPVRHPNLSRRIPPSPPCLRFIGPENIWMIMSRPISV